VTVASVARDYATANVQTILGSGPGRRAAPCAHAPQCGGCAYQDLDYAAQLKLKASVLADSLRRAGVAWEPEVPVLASPETGWRTRATFHTQVEDGQVRLGLHRAGTAEVVDLDNCLQLSPEMSRGVRGIRSALSALGHLAAGARHLTLAESADGSELVASLETNLSSRDARRLEPLCDATDGLTGFAVAVGREGSTKYLVQKGQPYVHATVLGRRLRHHVGAFFQGNRFLVEPLARHVVGLTPPGGTVLDLYCGVGLFALGLAPHASDVIGVEADRFAVRDAVHNAKASALRNVRILRGQTLDYLRSSRRSEAERIILDPPRGGLGRGVVEAVAQRRPQTIVYVSCDPPTLARDLRELERNEYRPDSVQAFDLFPDTFHLETVVRLKPVAGATAAQGT
jgi:23S rRNA (uracil1939-C5)-methyltransferase